MAANKLTSILISLFLLSAVVVIVSAEPGPIEDAYWKEREAEAMNIAKNSASSDPMKVTEEFNANVAQLVMAKNSTRRHLMGHKHYSGPCQATNPIDACWRCDPNWANNRQKMADCVQGFGKKTTGGKGGPIYVVDDNSDDDVVNPKPGTLRHAVIQDGPLWITFKKSMVITLQQELLMTSNKTIDGRGANVFIYNGGGITLQFVSNIIITNIHVKHTQSKPGGIIRDSQSHLGLRTQSDGDGISLFGASNVWIDHVSMSHCADGLIDVIMSSTAITISNSHFTHHNEVMLFGASNSYPQDKIMQITLAFNHFGQQLTQRMPRIRFGFVHIVNNDYTHWEMYAIGGGMNPTIISQGNRFVAPDNTAAKEVTKREYTYESEWKNWNWRSEGDLMVNGAFFVESGNPTATKSAGLDMMPFKPGTLAASLTKFSGALECVIGKPC